MSDEDPNTTQSAQAKAKSIPKAAGKGKAKAKSLPKAPPKAKATPKPKAEPPAPAKPSGSVEAPAPPSQLRKRELASRNMKSCSKNCFFWLAGLMLSGCTLVCEKLSKS